MRSRINRIGFIIVGLAGFLVALSPAHGQIIYDQPASGNALLVYSHWSLKGDGETTKIDQLTIPLRSFVPIRENLEALFYVASSTNSLEDVNTDYSLSGLGDVRLQVNQSFNDDKMLLSVGLNLPTGKKKINPNEGPFVLQMLSQNYLTFPMRRFGEGFGFNMLVGGAQMIGELRCGAGLMYQFNGKYEPYQGVDKYDPGDFVSLNAGADWQANKTTVAADAILTTYTSDKLDDRKVFKQSTQLDLHLQARHGNKDFSLHGSIGYLWRGRNTLYSTDEKLKIFGNEFLLSGSLTRRFQQDWYVTPSAELKLIAANDEDFGNSTIFGLGGALGREINEQISGNVGFKYFTGNADSGNIDLSGFQLTASLTANL